MVAQESFIPPPMPVLSRTGELRERAASLPGGAVDLSVGNPIDPVPEIIIQSLKDHDLARPYPDFGGRQVIMGEVISDWSEKQLNTAIDPSDYGICIGTKEFIAGAPKILSLRDPQRDTVLYPEIAYPSYAMGADLAGCRAVPVAMDTDWKIDVSSIDPEDAKRALMLWINTPGNPAGGLDDLDTVVEWGRKHAVPVFSDECYVEFTWDGPARSVLQYGNEGVVAVHSLSKRSNLAGLRFGFYAGDPEIVSYCREIRRHQGLMVSGHAQVAGITALQDQEHVEVQRERYKKRLERLIGILAHMGIEASMPGGSFYLWVLSAEKNSSKLAFLLAEKLGVISVPGETYGPRGAGYVRLAAIVSEENLTLLEKRAEDLQK